MSLKGHLQLTVGSLVAVIALVLLLRGLTLISEVFGIVGAAVTLVYVPIFLSLALSLSWRAVLRRR